jgi:DNA-binding MurR/RpiR family transcriptional regulator
MSRRIVGILISAVVISSEASSQQSLQQLERSTDFEKALRAVDAIKHRKRLQCVISTANAGICGCLAQQLPVDTYVRSYVAIVSGDKGGQDYRQLSAADRMIVDRCVSGGR